MFASAEREIFSLKLKRTIKVTLKDALQPTPTQRKAPNPPYTQPQKKPHQDSHAWSTSSSQPQPPNTEVMAAVQFTRDANSPDKRAGETSGRLNPPTSIEHPVTVTISPSSRGKTEGALFSNKLNKIPRPREGGVKNIGIQAKGKSLKQKRQQSQLEQKPIARGKKEAAEY